MQNKQMRVNRNMVSAQELAFVELAGCYTGALSIRPAQSIFDGTQISLAGKELKTSTVVSRDRPTRASCNTRSLRCRSLV